MNFDDWRTEGDRDENPVLALLTFVLVIAAFLSLVVLTYFAMNYPVPS